MKHLRHAGLATCAAGSRFRQATLKLHQKFLDRLLMRWVWVQRRRSLEPGNEPPRINGAPLPQLQHQVAQHKARHRRIARRQPSLVLDLANSVWQVFLARLFR